jgi:hypothetical protein
MPPRNVLYSSKEEKAAAKSARRAARREAALAVKGQVSALAEPANWAAGLTLRYPPPPLCPLPAPLPCPAYHHACYSRVSVTCRSRARPTRQPTPPSQLRPPPACPPRRSSPHTHRRSSAGLPPPSR